MSIALLDVTSESSLDRVRRGRRPTSQARVEANRRNCRKSTGPTTPAGKRRASRNAMKHGMCSALSHLPGECDATFHTYVAELEEELRPATALQRVFFTEIANLSWRLRRLPEAQSKLFAEEMAKVPCDDGEELKASDVLARRFSDDPGCNGFARMDRYERGMRSQLLRLFRQFDQLKKHRPTTPYDPGEPPCPSEGSKPAWTAQQAAAQRAWFAEQERLHADGKQPDPEWLRLREVHQRQLAEAAEQRTEKAQARSSSKPDWYELRQAHLRQEAAAAALVVVTQASPPSVVSTEEATQGSQLQEEQDPRAKRSQSKPTEIVDSAQPAGKCAIPDAWPLTKRSQPAARDAAPVPERPNPVLEGAGGNVTNPPPTGIHR